MKSEPTTSKKKKIEIPYVDSESTTLVTSGKSTLVLAFFMVLAIETIGFFTIRSSIAQSLGQTLVVIDLGSVIVLFLGAATLAYLYYTRYVKRQIIFRNDTFTLMVGKRKFEYNWDEFSFVALSIASSHIGAKGFSIRIYTDDLEGEYVELPMYRFTKQIDIFELRQKINEKVNQSKPTQEKKKNKK
jgi:hypothetical protein